MQLAMAKARPSLKLVGEKKKPKTKRAAIMAKRATAKMPMEKAA